MFIDITTITALATWAVAIGTILILYWQTRVSQQLNSANAVLTLRERFDAPRMRKARRLLSQRLLANRHEDITNLEVAAFFELIGALTRQRMLSLRLVWEAFGTWVSGYHYAMRHPVDLIERARTALDDPLIMHEFDWLKGRVSDLDRRMLGGAEKGEKADRAEARALLRREAELDLDEGSVDTSAAGMAIDNAS